MNERPNAFQSNDAPGAANGAAPGAGAAEQGADAAQKTQSAAPKRRRFWLFAGLAGAASTLAACAQPGSGPRGEGGAWGGHWHGHHHHGWGRGGPVDPQRMAERVDRAVDRVLSRVGATDAQKQKVASIAKQAMTELAPMRAKMREARRQAMELLAAPAIDRAAIERLRAERLQDVDALSRRMSSAMIEAAEVLDAEQRAKLKAGLEQRMGRRWS